MSRGSFDNVYLQMIVLFSLLIFGLRVVLSLTGVVLDFFFVHEFPELVKDCSGRSWTW